MTRKEIFRVAVVLSALLCLVGCKSKRSAAPDGQSAGSTAQPAEKTASETITANQENPVADPVKPVVIIETSKGIMKVQLWPDKAPKTVENFLQYVDKGFYDGTIFHRVINGFMIQGGGFTPDMQQKTTAAEISNEASAGVRNDRGTLAMARTSDPHSATSQFFINHVNNDFLNHTAKTPQGWGYCVFGKVTDGLNTLDAITKAPTKTVGHYENVPAEAVIIISIRRQ